MAVASPSFAVGKVPKAITVNGAHKKLLPRSLKSARPHHLEHTDIHIELCHHKPAYRLAAKPDHKPHPGVKACQNRQRNAADHTAQTARREHDPG